MNPVLILTHNNLELTKKCVASIRAQNIPTEIHIVDNESTDETDLWLSEEGLNSYMMDSNKGVSFGWNFGLHLLFRSHPHVLVINNDTIIPPWFYKTLLRVTQFKPDECLFVTGSSTDKMDDMVQIVGKDYAVVPHPDFSAFLITREAWEKIGPFDEAMVNYAGDNDWHVRAHRAGVTLWNSSIPFYHERSSTLKNASPKDRREIELQADADREVFRDIYGCYPWDQQYAELFK